MEEINHHQPHRQFQGIDHQILLAVDDWRQRVRSMILAFWRDSDDHFWRDTKEIASTTPEHYYPTATFMSVAALHESAMVSIKPSTEQPYDCIGFLSTLQKRKLHKVIESSAVASRTGSHQWNVYTAAWAVRALLAVYSTLRRRSTVEKLSTRTVRKCFDWITISVNDQCERIRDHLESSAGATLPHDRSHPFLTAHAVDVLARARRHRLFHGALRRSIRQRICENARSEARRIVASYVTSSLAPGDLVALAYHANLLAALADSAATNLIASCVDLVCKAQAASGGWPVGRSWLAADQGHGVHISSFHVGATLVDLTLPLNRNLALPPSDTKRDRDAAFLTLFGSMISSLSTVIVQRRAIQGWCEDSLYDHPLAESWTTSCVLLFLNQLRQYLQECVLRDTLEPYDTTWPNTMGSWVSWEALEEPDPDRPVLQYLSRHFLFSLQVDDPMERTTLPAKGDHNVSLILFGPPGTGKTNVVKALAKTLGWPLVNITPSLFLSQGLNAIDARAEAVFRDLKRLERAVVLFDECDELFRQRLEAADGGQLSTAALITGAMLPRLQELHDRGRIIFVLATNRLKAIDSAVKREGRIDHIVGFGPPEPAAIERLIVMHGLRIPRKHTKELADAMYRFTRDEVIRTIGYVERSRIRWSRVKRGDLEKRVREIMPNDGLIIGMHEMETYRDEKDKTCHVVKEAKLPKG